MKSTMNNEIVGIDIDLQKESISIASTEEERMKRLSKLNMATKYLIAE